MLPEINETLKGSFTKFFGTVRQKIFEGKLWYPLLSIKFSDTPIFLKHWRDAHKIFWHCETKNFRRKNVRPPFSSIEIFETRNFLKNSRIPLRFFRYCETWNFQLKIVICPLLSKKFFRYQKFSGRQKGSFTKIFVSVLWDKKNWQNRDAPPSYASKISRKEFFWKTEVFCNGIFWYSQTKTFRRKMVIPPSYP